VLYIPNGISRTATIPKSTMPTNKNALWIFSPSTVEHCWNRPVCTLVPRRSFIKVSSTTSTLGGPKRETRRPTWPKVAIEDVEKKLDGPFCGPDQYFADPEDEVPKKARKTTIRPRISHQHLATNLLACYLFIYLFIYFVLQSKQTGGGWHRGGLPKINK